MSVTTSCSGCGLSYNCVCSVVPKLLVKTHIALLMHENELARETNTGQWLVKSLPHCSQHIWQRTSPSADLLNLLTNDHYFPVLLFPSKESISVNETQSKATIEGKIPLFIILDATWQEAKKILRKSSWLTGIPLVHITPASSSLYQLRRNQTEGHLCTLEVAAEVIKELGEETQAKMLTNFLTHYMKVFKADKSGHLLKT